MPLPGHFQDEGQLDKNNEADLKRDINVNSLIMNYNMNNSNEFDFNEQQQQQMQHHNILSSASPIRKLTRINLSSLNLNRLDENSNRMMSESKAKMSKMCKSKNIDKKNKKRERESFEKSLISSSEVQLEKSFHMDENHFNVREEMKASGSKNGRLFEVLKAAEGDIIFGSSTSKLNQLKECNISIENRFLKSSRTHGPSVEFVSEDLKRSQEKMRLERRKEKVGEKSSKRREEQIKLSENDVEEDDPKTTNSLKKKLLQISNLSQAFKISKKKEKAFKNER